MSGTKDEWGWVWIVVVVAGLVWLWSSDGEAEPPPIRTKPVEELTPLPDARPTEPYRVAATKDGSVFMIDPQTITGQREARRAWIIIDAQKDKTVAYRKVRELIWTNCETGEVKTLSSIAYSPDGDVMSSRDFRFDEADVTYYPPGTIGAAAPKAMCLEIYDAVK